MYCPKCRAENSEFLPTDIPNSSKQPCSSIWTGAKRAMSKIADSELIYGSQT